MTAAGLFGVVAEFERPEDLLRALEAAQAAGYTCLEAFSPLPLRPAAKALGVQTRALLRIAAVAGLIGASVQFAAQYWMNAVDYPLNVGGRPLNSWPAFLPATLIVAILWAAAATLIAMLLIVRLPRLNHPVFSVPGFARASEDRFFLLVSSQDPLFERAAVAGFLDGLGPRHVQEVLE
jgi:hypothetical protein